MENGNAKQPMIELIDASLGYAEEREATLPNIDLTIYAGEMVAVIGPNGAGKSTLMKCLFGIYHSNKGKIIFKGKEVKFREGLNLVLNLDFDRP